jgi:hypothetical protein
MVRGAVPVLQVSANSSNPTSTPPLFSNINPAFPSYFAAFSPQRIFRPDRVDFFPNVAVGFNVPGTLTPATVSGFGAVFTDVNRSGSATIEFLDFDRGSLGVFTVPAGSGHQTVSFFGAVFPGARIYAVLIRLGTEPATGAIEDATHDIAALDDLVYTEPQPLPPPSLDVTTPTAQTDFGATGPFLTLSGHTTLATHVAWMNDRGDHGTAWGRESTWSIDDIPIAAGPNVITITATSRVDHSPIQKVRHVNGEAFTYSFAEGSTGGFLIPTSRSRTRTASPRLSR